MEKESLIDNEYYINWCFYYRRYLSSLYDILLRYLKTKEKKELTFEKFCKFCYDNSSGEFIEYV
jgi:hypothetical protein